MAWAFCKTTKKLCSGIVWLLNIMGLQAIYKGPNTSKKHPQHLIYPYLLRKLAITRPNQVWCSDISYFFDAYPTQRLGGSY
jgi:transposase InsO family protein